VGFSEFLPCVLYLLGGAPEASRVAVETRLGERTGLRRLGGSHGVGDLLAGRQHVLAWAFVVLEGGAPALGGGGEVRATTFEGGNPSHSDGGNLDPLFAFLEGGVGARRGEGNKEARWGERTWLGADCGPSDHVAELRHVLAWFSPVLERGAQALGGGGGVRHFVCLVRLVRVCVWLYLYGYTCP
jgi:hypothetical protein